MTVATILYRDESDSALDAFYADVAAHDLQPLWTQGSVLLTPQPRPAAVPFVWTWPRVAELAERGGRLVGIDRGGDRRVLAMANPGLGGRPYATATIWAGIQYLNAGEVAPAHRHTPGALRFVLEGSGVWTLVNGDAVSMAPGDLVLTPSMSWHEHHNPGEDPMIWLDGLDLPLVESLDAVFYDDGPDEVDTSADGLSRSELRYGGGPGLVPGDDQPPLAHSPLLVYRWAATDVALGRLLCASRQGTASIRFTNPASGADVMPTMRCEMHRVAAGSSTDRIRETGSSVWACFDGDGVVELNGADTAVGRGDIIAVPSWTSWSFRAARQLTLFRVSDAPVLEAMALMRRIVEPATSTTSTTATTSLPASVRESPQFR
jgi:gentisate 1,2-dioxygenase